MSEKLISHLGPALLLLVSSGFLGCQNGPTYVALNPDGEESCLSVYVGDEEQPDLLGEIPLEGIGLGSETPLGVAHVEPPYGPLESEHYVYVDIEPLFVDRVARVLVQFSRPDDWFFGDDEIELAPSPLIDTRWENTIISGGGVEGRTDQICFLVLGEESE